MKQAAKARSEETPAQTPAVAIISYDEKPSIQALANKAPDLPPKPMRHRTVARDHEYVRLGTQSLLAGIDLMTGVVHASVERRHRSREFVKFLKKLDAAHPPATAIKLILDNHSAHKSKETMAWLAQQSKGRFTLVYTPKHGSWLNLVGDFSSSSPAPCFAISASFPCRSWASNPRRNRPDQPPPRRSHMEVENCRGPNDIMNSRNRCTISSRQKIGKVLGGDFVPLIGRAGRAWAGKVDSAWQIPT